MNNSLMNPFKTPHLRFVLTEPHFGLTISDHNLLLIVKINKVIPPEKKKFIQMFLFNATFSNFKLIFS